MAASKRAHGSTSMVIGEIVSLSCFETHATEQQITCMAAINQKKNKGKGQKLAAINLRKWLASHGVDTSQLPDQMIQILKIVVPKVKGYFSHPIIGVYWLYYFSGCLIRVK